MPDNDEREVEAVTRALIAEGCGSGWAYPRAHKIVAALDAVRGNAGEREVEAVAREMTQAIELAGSGHRQPVLLADVRRWAERLDAVRGNAGTEPVIRGLIDANQRLRDDQREERDRLRAELERAERERDAWKQKEAERCAALDRERERSKRAERERDEGCVWPDCDRSALREAERERDEALDAYSLVDCELKAAEAELRQARAALDFIADGNHSLVQRALLKARLGDEKE